MGVLHQESKPLITLTQTCHSFRKLHMCFYLHVYCISLICSILLRISQNYCQTKTICFYHRFDSPSKETQGYYEILAMMLQLIDFETVGTLAHRKGCLWWGIDIMDVLSNCSMDGPIKSPEVPAYCIVGWKKTSSTSHVLLQMCSQTWLKGENATSSQDTCITWINPVTVGVESKSWASGCLRHLACGISSTQGDPRGHR